MDDVLDPKEVAALLKVHPRTVVNWANQGVLPGCKIGDLWRFRRQVIEEQIKKKEEQSALSIRQGAS